jgi:uncharacterized protein with HEPN domain
MAQPSDRQRLQHIVEAIDWIAEFVSAMEFDDFQHDRKTQLSVERSLEIMGEAANHLSLEITTDFPDVPWRQIVDLRNVVSHEYFQVRLDIIWDTATKEVPALREQIDAILQSLAEN